MRGKGVVIVMNLKEAMEARHSVRRYLDRQIEGEKVEILQKEIEKVNAESGLHIQLILNEPKAFSGPIAHYGSFRNCKNYFVIVGAKDLQEAAGYQGEKLVLLAQQLGLNTCWVAATYSKGKVPATIGEGEKLLIVIALGYGETQGTAHKSKPMEKLCKTPGEMPKWFENAMRTAMNAPTAINQQKFFFTLKVKDVVAAKALTGPCSKIDLGIVKYHFEIGAEGHPFKWE